MFVSSNTIKQSSMIRTVQLHIIWSKKVSSMMTITKRIYSNFEICRQLESVNLLLK